MRKSRFVARFVLVIALTAFGAAAPAHALPPPAGCVGLTVPGSCTFDHLDPLSYHNGFVAISSTGPVTVELYNGATLVLACTGFNSCSNSGLVPSYPGNYTCVATGAGGVFACGIS